MKFQSSERIITNVLECEMLSALESALSKATHVPIKKIQGSLVARGIGTSRLLGYNINRIDETRITLKAVEDGWLLASETNYHPSLTLWLTAPLTLLFCLPLFVLQGYFYHKGKKMVRDAIKEAFRVVNNELSRQVVTHYRANMISDLEKLGTLKEKGLITETEFSAKKKQLLAELG